MKHLTKKEQQYLQSKHTGGMNNAKGNSYESFYAVKTVAELLVRYKNNTSVVSFQTQVPMAYVDDLTIYEPSIYTYHQIKDVKDLTWNKGNKHHTIKDDFIGQRKLCNICGEQCHLKLVYSNASCSVKKMPRGFKRFTSVEFFPAKDLGALVIMLLDFQNNLRQLLYLGDSLPLDRIFDFAKWILGEWCSVSSGSKVGLDVIEQSVSRNMPEYYSNVTLLVSPQCAAVFQSAGVTYQPLGHQLKVSSGSKSITFDWSQIVQDKILAARPGNIYELFTLV